MSRRNLRIMTATMAAIFLLFGFKFISIDPATDQAIIVATAIIAVITELWLALTGPEDEE